MIRNSKIDDIEAKIAKLESETTAELMVVIAKEADDYRYIAALAASLVSLVILPIVMILWLGLSSSLANMLSGFGDFYGFFVQSLIGFSVLQLMLFVICYFIFMSDGIKYHLVPKKIKQKRAQRLANEQFMINELSLKENRSGILLFISEFEHVASIICDRAIAAKIDDQDWQKMIDDLILSIKSNKAENGIENLLDQMTDRLRIDFANEENVTPNELSNEIIFI